MAKASGRTPIIAGNWKMNHNHLTAIQVVQKLAFSLDDKDYAENEVVVIPPFTALRSVQTTIDADRIKIALGAQNCHWENEGAFTGEISALMLAKLTCKYVVVGHSERRQIFGETDDIVNRKVKAVLGAGMRPIMCVGETLEEHEAGQTADKVSGQVRAGLAKVDPALVAESVLAYEPIWAIGTGKNATPQDANDTIGVIRRVVREQFGDDVAHKVRIQYGGSVKAGNAADLMAMPEIDGALVGGASLDAEEFSRIVRWRR